MLERPVCAGLGVARYVASCALLSCSTKFALAKHKLTIEWQSNRQCSKLSAS